MKFLKFVAFFFILWQLSLQVANSASVNLTDPNTTTLDLDTELAVNVNLNISAADGTAYYFRGAFAKVGSNKYCGLTWNGTDWYSGPYSSNEGWKNLPKTTVSSSSAALNLKAKLDKEDNDCLSPGSYTFQVQRYTEGGSASFDDQNRITLSVSYPTFTPTPSPTVKASPLPTVKQVSSTTAKSPTATQKAISESHAKSPDNSPTNIIINAELIDDATSTIAGITATISSIIRDNLISSPSSNQSLLAQINSDRAKIIFMLLLGIIFLSTGIFQSFRLRFRQR